MKQKLTVYAEFFNVYLNLQLAVGFEILKITNTNKSRSLFGIVYDTYNNHVYIDLLFFQFNIA